ncbi:MAG: Ig-like domain-containing domain [Adhaeribacter sp.]
MLLKSPLLYIAAISLFISSCASVGTPEGGAKDAEAPKLLSSTPKEGELNVKTRELTLTFNEEIQTKDITRQMLITPNVNNPITTSFKKEILKIAFEKDLLPNTTYFINFRGGVVDVTESNRPENLSLTFSTGAFIDSGQVKGTIRDLYTNEPEKNINVALYPTNDTTNIRKHRPYYITQTDEQGNYTFRNIRLGSYRIYAHQDRNNNMTYDNEKERIGYQQQPITINAATPNVDLVTLRVDTRKPLAESSQKLSDEFRITYNEGLTQIKVAPLQNPAGTAPFIAIVNKNGATVSLFPTSPLNNEKFLVSATDSSGNIKTDTVAIALDTKKVPRTAESIEVKNFNGQLTKTDLVEIAFKVPVKITDPQALTLVEDSTSRRPLTFPQDFKLDPTATTLTFTQPLKANKTVQILIDTTKIMPVTDGRFRKQTYRFPITNKIQVGTLLGAVKTSYKRYWVEVLNAQQEVVYTLDSPKQIKLDRMEPGKYRIRVKIDEDNDGIWRQGNKDLVLPAEKIYHYPAVIDIMANWEIELKDPPLVF